jgi:RNA polymerase sigma factor (sigma-70 family)
MGRRTIPGRLTGPHIDIPAANRLAEKYVRLALKWKFQNLGRASAIGMDPSELESMALLALVEASRTYDPTRSRFSTWAIKVMNSFLGREYKKLQYLKYGSGKIPQQFPLNEQGKAFADPGETDPVEIVDLRRGLERLPRRIRLVMEKRFIDDLTLQEVGLKLGVTKEYVRQLQNRGIEMLRVFLEGAAAPVGWEGGEPRSEAAKALKAKRLAQVKSPSTAARRIPDHILQRASSDQSIVSPHDHHSNRRAGHQVPGPGRAGRAEILRTQGRSGRPAHPKNQDHPQQ